MTIAERYEETIPLPRAIRFPVELIPPEGFDPGRPETWPKVDGRLEYVNGRLLFMPPCGDVQQDTVADVVASLVHWVRTHTEFVVATNEAGILLGNDVRAADAAVFRRSETGPYRRGFRRVAPVLAVEVAGEDDDEAAMRDKAFWYLNAGVQVVWIVLPETRQVLVVTKTGEQMYGSEEKLSIHPALPDLVPSVAEFFVQVSAG
jgi:Uma2 family endonuclease